MLFKELRGNISHFAFDLIKKENDQSINIGLNPSLCGHVVHTVYKVPCAHELLEYGCADQPIPLATVDEHWLKLTILPNITKEKDLFGTAEMVFLKKLYNQSTEVERKVILRKIKDIALPIMTSLKEPSLIIPKGRTRGTKRRSQKDKKHASSTKRDPFGFEYAKTGEELELARKNPDKSSQVSNQGNIWQRNQRLT